jgi:hypothetical protein
MDPALHAVFEQLNKISSGQEELKKDISTGHVPRKYIITGPEE